MQNATSVVSLLYYCHIRMHADDHSGQWEEFLIIEIYVTGLSVI
jgi:hypothetical protein